MNFLKREKPKLIISNQSGQGVLEYILLLSITVSVIVGLIYQFNSNFRDYAENYFGSYLECLLQSGELPTLGSQEKNNSASSCNKNYKKFTITNGRPPINNSSQNNDREKNSTAKTRGAGANSSGSRFRSRSNSSAGGSSSGGRGSGRFNNQNNKFSANSSNKSKDDVTFSAGGSPTLGKLNNNKSSKNNKDRKRNQVAKLKAYNPNNSKENSNKVKVRKIKQENEDANTSKSFRANASVDKSKLKPPNTDFSLGDYLRYFLIAAILIVIFVIIGGQVFQASKNGGD